MSGKRSRQLRREALKLHMTPAACRAAKRAWTRTHDLATVADEAARALMRPAEGFRARRKA